MSLKLMYITNDPDIATVAQSVGIDRIFIDMECLGKEDRQGGMDTVKSHHTVEDVRRIAQVLTTSELLVRVNPIHEKTDAYPSSREEIDAVIAAGADILMLPYFKTADEVKAFISLVGGRAKTMLLMETAQANENADEILDIDGIDEVHIGLNDMHLAYKKRFMFELLTDGTVEQLCEKCRKRGLPYGFGGIARLGYGMLPAENVITEHYRLGSTKAILSRSFCNASTIGDPAELRALFELETAKIRRFEEKVAKYSAEEYEENRREVERLVKIIVSGQE